MTDSDHPITVGQKDSAQFTHDASTGKARIFALLFGVSIDALLIFTGVALLTAAHTVTVSGVIGVILLIVLLVSPSTWFFWRLARMRLEISKDGIVDVGMMGRRFVPADRVLRVDVVDGRSLRRPRGVSRYPTAGSGYSLSER